MFLTADLRIDPSQITVIKRISNANMLYRLYDILTVNTASQKVEQETFTAISILNQIQMGLVKLGVDNVVRINVDNYDYFYDTEAKKHDLYEAFLEIEKKLHPLESQRFNLLELVIEHERNDIKYLIDIKVKRKHRIGEYPIEIKINGAFEDLMLEADESLNNLKMKLKTIFESQKSYEVYLKEKEVKFQSFVNEFERTLSSFIKVDGIKLDFINKIVRPRILIEGRREIRENKHSDPFFQGFAGIYKYMTYSLYWGTCCSNNNIHIKEFTLCDDFGKDILAVGSIGFNSGEFDILKPQTKFDTSSISDLILYDDDDLNEVKEDQRHRQLENDEEVLTNYVSFNLAFEEDDIAFGK